MRGEQMKKRQIIAIVLIAAAMISYTAALITFFGKGQPTESTVFLCMGSVLVCAGAILFSASAKKK